MKRINPFIALILSFLITQGCHSYEEIVIKNDNKILIVPDTQNYTKPPELYHYLDAISNYYANKTNEFSACLHVGDLTGRNKAEQYTVMYQHFFSRFPKGNEPIFCLGNHDYGENGVSDTRTSNLPSNMAPKSDVQMDGCDYENYVRFLNIGNEQYAILVLEFAPRNEAIEWANDVVKSYSQIPFIILTHVFTNKYGQIHDENDPDVYHGGSQKSYYMDRDYINDSMEIFNKLIYYNPNVIMVVCGHTFLPEYIGVTSKKNNDGNEVYVVTVNYQHYVEGGSGFVGILELGEESYRIRSFSTVTETYGDIDITFDRPVFTL